MRWKQTAGDAVRDKTDVEGRGNFFKLQKLF
jgi:hypothetical protein